MSGSDDTQDVGVRIESLAAGGRGVARRDGKVWFVRGALPGDVVEVEVEREGPRFVEARAVRRLQDSSERREPPCPIQERCGGCPWMALVPEAQRRWKRILVEEALKRIGKIAEPPVAEVVPASEPLAYRNKVEFHFGVDESGRRIVGLHRGDDPSRLVEVERCLLLDDDGNRALAAGRRDLEGAREGARFVVRRSREFGRTLLVLRGGPGDFPEAERVARDLEEISGVVVVEAVSGRRGGARSRVARGEGFLEERLGELVFRIPAAGFFQVSSSGAEVLLRHVLDAAGSPRTVLELYGGVGAFGLHLAKGGAAVTIVEADPDAVAAGKEAAERQTVRGARFVRADALEGARAWRGAPPDLVVADPPRTGLGKGVAAILGALEAPRVVLVGCDPATFARDVRGLIEVGYRLRRAVPLDLFPQTAHVETVGVLDR